MKITYDEDVDAMYVQLIDGEHECRTVSLNDDVSLDLDARERLVGIEILDAKRVLGRGKLPRVLIDNMALVAKGRCLQVIRSCQSRIADGSVSCTAIRISFLSAPVA